MKLTILDPSGRATQKKIDADDAVFGIQPNLAVVHQALLAQLANRRRGTASTLTRSQHSGPTTKTRKQKGTGRARQGSVSSPVRRGGAVAHGPHPRSHVQRIPKRMRRLAIRSLLSQRLAEGNLQVITASEFSSKTKDAVKLFDVLGVKRSAIFVTEKIFFGVIV